ncbi:MAG TPA: maleylacetoacetate isomerase [Aliidongia sp.]|uniref:maleylacetoacetate isomerase n=1 Tax=Aliidongia sp. TaxID=1914230 RepID=UPI002DDD525E|nr:maleylacetoacetate isomerase [Aliidongia sp.]HEV2676031.1 maleylacetoacetate isomerase [Aliidongia sp.]
MIRMYGFWRSAASFRVRVALNLKGLAFEEEMIDIDAGVQHTPDYLALNPAAAVPSIRIDDGPPLTQSLAILEYLEETHPTPPLLPADARGRSRVRALSLIWAADHHPLITPRIRRYLADEMGQDEAARTAWIRHWFREGLAVGEARLAGDAATGLFCHGDTLTFADLCLVSQAAGARGFKVDFSDLPTVSRIVENCLALDEFARAHPLRQPGAPAQH